MLSVASSELVITPTPNAHFGIGAVGKLAGIVRDTGSDAVVVVTAAALTATPVVASVTSVLEAAGIPVTVFSGVHPNPTTGDLAAGAEAVAAAAWAGRWRPRIGTSITLGVCLRASARGGPSLPPRVGPSPPPRVGQGQWMMKRPGTMMMNRKRRLTAADPDH